MHEIIFEFTYDKVGSNFVGRLRPYLRHIQIARGVFQIAIGLLLVTNRMTTIAIWAQQNGFYLDLPLGAASSSTYLIAIVAHSHNGRTWFSLPDNPEDRPYPEIELMVKSALSTP